MVHIADTSPPARIAVMDTARIGSRGTPSGGRPGRADALQPGAGGGLATIWESITAASGSRAIGLRPGATPAALASASLWCGVITSVSSPDALDLSGS